MNNKNGACLLRSQAGTRFPSRIQKELLCQKLLFARNEQSISVAKRVKKETGQTFLSLTGMIKEFMNDCLMQKIIIINRCLYNIPSSQQHLELQKFQVCSLLLLIYISNCIKNFEQLEGASSISCQFMTNLKQVFPLCSFLSHISKHIQII